MTPPSTLYSILKFFISMQSRHEFDRLYDERVNQSYSNLTDFSARAFTAHYADTMWTMALALNATEGMNIFY